MSAPTRPSSSQRFALNLWLPSPWIAPSFGRTDHSPLRTVRATCRCTRLSSFLFSLTFGLWPSSDNVSERFGSPHLAYLHRPFTEETCFPSPLGSSALSNFD